MDRTYTTDSKLHTTLKLPTQKRKFIDQVGDPHLFIQEKIGDK